MHAKANINHQLHTVRRCSYFWVLCFLAGEASLAPLATGMMGMGVAVLTMLTKWRCQPSSSVSSARTQTGRLNKAVGLRRRGYGRRARLGAPGWNAIPSRLPCWTATGSCAVSETRPTLLTSSCERTSTLAPLRVITGARMKTAGIARPGANVALSVVSKESTCAARGGTRSAQLKVVAGGRRHWRARDLRAEEIALH